VAVVERDLDGANLVDGHDAGIQAILNEKLNFASFGLVLPNNAIRMHLFSPMCVGQAAACGLALVKRATSGLLVAMPERRRFFQTVEVTHCTLEVGEIVVQMQEFRRIAE